VIGLVAWLALLVAVAALVLGVVVMRQNADTTRDLRRHRLAHAAVQGSADPDRRQEDAGPPEGQPERRRAQRYAPPRVPITPLPPSRPTASSAPTAPPPVPERPSPTYAPETRARDERRARRAREDEDLT